MLRDIMGVVGMKSEPLARDEARAFLQLLKATQKKHGHTKPLSRKKK